MCPSTETITVTEVGNIGEKVRGSFSITANIFENGAPSVNTATLSGEFSVTREPDDITM